MGGREREGGVKGSGECLTHLSFIPSENISSHRGWYKQPNALPPAAKREGNSV